VTGWSASDIYLESLDLVDKHLPFFSLKFREECSKELKQKFITNGLLDDTGRISKEKFFDFVTRED